MLVTYKTIDCADIADIRMIDRSEIIDEVYYYIDGKLELQQEHYTMKDFPPGEREKIIERQRKILGSGGTAIGAYDGSILVGIVSVENRLRGKNADIVKMDILFVSDGYRKLGIAKELVGRAKSIGASFQAKKLYISATPSKNTVDFYMRLGCRLVEELDAELFEMEPEDIHLELSI